MVATSARVAAVMVMVVVVMMMVVVVVEIMAHRTVSSPDANVGIL